MDSRVDLARKNQPVDELARKQAKASRKGIWTQEDVDYADAVADRYLKEMEWDDEPF